MMLQIQTIAAAVSTSMLERSLELSPERALRFVDELTDHCGSSDGFQDRSSITTIVLHQGERLSRLLKPSDGWPRAYEYSLIAESAFITSLMCISFEHRKEWYERLEGCDNGRLSVHYRNAHKGFMPEHLDNFLSVCEFCGRQDFNMKADTAQLYGEVEKRSAGYERIFWDLTPRHVLDSGVSLLKFLAHEGAQWSGIEVLTRAAEHFRGMRTLCVSAPKILPLLNRSHEDN